MKKITVFKVSYLSGDFLGALTEVVKGYCFTRSEALIISGEGASGNWGKGEISEVELECLIDEKRYFLNGVEVTDKIRILTKEIYLEMQKRIIAKLTEEEVEYILSGAFINNQSNES